MAIDHYWPDRRPFHEVINLDCHLLTNKFTPTKNSRRQYYTYVTDTRCKRVGTQCWVFGAIMFTEAIICVKFGKDIFERTQMLTIALWLAIQLILSILCLYGCVLYHRYKGKVS